MNFNKNIRRFFRKSVVIPYVCLSIALAGTAAVPGYAGPADEAAAPTQEAGPGGTQGQSSGGPAGPGGGQAEEGQGTSGQTGNLQSFDWMNSVAAPDPGAYYNQALAEPIVHPVDRYSYDQMEQDIQALASRYGSRLTVNVIGQSLDGRNIYDLVVGNPNAGKKLLIQGAIHGREYIAVPLIMQQAETLLAGSEGGSYRGMALSAMLDQAAIHFVPMANPDGVTISQLGDGALRTEPVRQAVQGAYAADVAEGKTALGYAEYLTRWKSNGRGVDLNHNFDASWQVLSPDSSRLIGKRGDAPLSEPESAALAQLAMQNHFTATVSYHAMGRVIYWDTHGNRKEAESYEMAQAAGRATGYSVLGSKGVGGFKDWAQIYEAAPAPGITIELGRSACPVAFTEYPGIWEQNKEIPALFCHYVLTH